MSCSVVSFNYAAWAARYPELAYIPQATAQQYFNEATLYCDNSWAGPVQDATVLAILLNMLTAHIAVLNSPTQDGQPASPLVGRIARAGQGTVSVETQNDYPPGTVQWYQQTKYGAAYWTATAAYRTMRYVPARRGPPFGRFGRPW